MNGSDDEERDENVDEDVDAFRQLYPVLVSRLLMCVLPLIISQVPTRNVSQI